MSGVILCQYFIQNEDIKDKSNKKSISNAFVLNKKADLKEVTVFDVKTSFPFDISHYHVRFQKKIGNMKVWVDTSKDSVAVPNLDGLIKMKLLRFPHGIREKIIVSNLAHNEHENPVFEKTKSHPVHNENLVPPREKHVHHSNSTNNLAPPHKNYDNNIHKAMSNQDPDEGLIGDFGDDPSFAHKKTPDMDFNIDTNDIFGDKKQENLSNAAEAGSTTNEGEFINFETNDNPPPPAPAPAPSGGDDNLGGLLSDLNGINFSSDEPKSEEKKDGPTDIRKHVKDIQDNEERERVEWAEAMAKHDNRIKFWKGPSIPNSVKTLICTLHTVIWNGANWKPIGMDKLDDPNQVKKWYRKAILISHPDKTKNETTEVKFISNRIFGALNEAYKVFEATGQ